MEFRVFRKILIKVQNSAALLSYGSDSAQVVNSRAFIQKGRQWAA